MPEPTPLAKKINELNRLRDEAEPADSLRRALTDRSCHVRAKAAEMVSELRLSALVPDLVEAFRRSFINPLKRDPGCVAKIAVATALVELECTDVEPYREGIVYQQFEPVWGGEQDTAAELRAVCAAGMLQSASCMEALLHFGDLLADPCRPARIGAARAIAGLGHWEGIPLLRLKLLSGGEEPEVVGECCSALLKLAPEDGLDLVSRQLSAGDPDVALQAAVALGESRNPRALEPLRGRWQVEEDGSVRAMLLTCIGLLRSAESQEFLVGLIRGSDHRAAADAMRALAPFSMLEGLREQVQAAVEDAASRTLFDVFEAEFGAGK